MTNAERQTDAYILIVDDDPSIVRLLTRVLQTAGYTNVHGTIDSAEVPGLLQSIEPDLVVLDLNMPGMDGFALLTDIQTRLPQDSFLPVLTVSGLADPQSKERAFARGAKDYLVKPLDLGEFVLHVNSLLETRFLSERLKASKNHMAEVVGRRTEELEQSNLLRQQAEAAYHETEQYLEEARSLAHLGTWNWDVATDEVTWSKELFEISGTPVIQHVTMAFMLSQLLQPHSALLFERELHRLLELGGSFDVELDLARARGGACSMLCRGGAVRDEKGHVVRIAGTMLDITERKVAERRLSESFNMLRAQEKAIIRVLGTVTEIRDPYTAGHQNQVAGIGNAIALRMGLPEEQVSTLEKAALLHDIGKISVPLEILNNPGRLSDAQLALVRGHVTSSGELLRPIDFGAPVAEAVLQHHERLDGSGYPAGLKDGEILLEAKILAVADVVDAMTSHRPYRPAVGVDAALRELRENRGTYYDQAAVDACIELCENGDELAEIKTGRLRDTGAA
jgi:response regulator RpfG family c-di-GMP phosphodiesterase